MDPATWLATHARMRGEQATFACLPGCGFCCTYPPEVDRATFARISEATGLKRTTVDPEGTPRLPLLGGCGACVLLKDRACSAYDVRPKHCRLFPFHVYFGRTVEVYANAVCPGLDSPSAGPTSAGLASAVATVPTSDLERRKRQALETHAEFEHRARETDTWGDVDALRGNVPDRVAVTEEGWTGALARLKRRDEHLPMMVLPAPAFEWRAWRLSGRRIERLRVEEKGELVEVDTFARPEQPAALTAPGRRALARLASYECFVGSAFDLVDASEYEMPVAEAVEVLLDEVAGMLALGEVLVKQEGLPADERWLAAFVEPEFYDLSSIGGWL